MIVLYQLTTNASIGQAPSFCSCHANNYISIQLSTSILLAAANHYQPNHVTFIH
jgi:hypothetical protein